MANRGSPTSFDSRLHDWAKDPDVLAFRELMKPKNTLARESGSEHPMVERHLEYRVGRWMQRQIFNRKY